MSVSSGFHCTVALPRVSIYIALLLILIIRGRHAGSSVALTEGDQGSKSQGKSQSKQIAFHYVSSPAGRSRHFLETRERGKSVAGQFGRVAD
jgi:hypothetical protein